MKWSIPTRVIDSGRQLVDQAAVTRVLPDEERGVWEADVVEDRTYHVALDGSGKEEDTCHCAAWQRDGYCRHTVAVELFLRDHDVPRAMRFADKPLFKYPETLGEGAVDIDVLYQSVFAVGQPEQTTAQATGIQPLHVYFEIHDEATEPYALSDRHVFYLRLRIGHETAYVVNHWHDFVTALLTQAEYPLNNQAHDTVRLAPEAFTMADYQLLIKLATIERQRQTIALTEETAPASASHPERFYLDAATFHTLLKQHDSVTFHFFIDDTPRSLQFEKKSARPMLFSVAEQAGEWTLTMADAVSVYRYYGVIIYAGRLYTLTAAPAYYDRLLHLRESFYEHDGTLHFDTPAFRRFFSLFGYVMLEHTLIDHIVRIPIQEPIEPLAVELVIDLRHLELSVAPRYHYGSWTVAADSKQAHLPEEAILLRQAAEEQAVIRFLLQNGFQATESAYTRKFTRLKDAMAALKSTLSCLPDEWQVTYSERLSGWQGDGGVRGKLSMQPAAGNRYLTVQFSVDDVEEAEVERLLHAIEQKERYLELHDGRVVDVEHIVPDEQQQLLRELQKTTQDTKSTYRLPAYQLLRYSEVLNHPEVLRQFYEDVTHFYSEDYHVNERLTAKLADYQTYAVQWLNMLARHGLGGMLADEMGLGKTVQTIAFLLDYTDQHPDTQVLILAPASVVYNWQREIHRFAPDLSVAVIDGSVEERATLRDETDATVWITSYHSYRNDQDAYHECTFDVLVLDEAQALKNENTVLYRSVAVQDRLMCIGLCGTPLENNLQEFWALMQLVLPGLFPQKNTYRALSIEEIQQIAAPFLLRRTKQQVALELPEKRVSDRYASLTTEQKNLYLAYLADIQQKLAEQSDAGGAHMEILAAITRLRQICCHPKLVDADYAGQSGKFDYFKRLLAHALQNERHILVFSQFTGMLALIGEALAEAEVPYLSITGETGKAERQQRIDRFNDGEVSVFLISLRAGGVGINLTRADTIFLYDLWWNPSVEEQAIGRAHRIGQTHDVTIYRMITEGTIEERIAELQAEKRKLFDRLFDGENMQTMPKLTMDDLKFILGVSAESEA